MPHINELIDFIINVFIVHENKVLLIHHKKFNKWLPIGGHIELNEDPEEALFTEVQEECGLEIEVIGSKPTVVSEGTKFLYTPIFLDIHKINDTHKHVGLNYFARSTSDNFMLNKEEHNDIRWFTKKELSDAKYNLQADVRFYANEALNSE